MNRSAQALCGRTRRSSPAGLRARTRWADDDDSCRGGGGLCCGSGRRERQRGASVVEVPGRGCHALPADGSPLCRLHSLVSVGRRLRADDMVSSRALLSRGCSRDCRVGIRSRSAEPPGLDCRRCAPRLHRLGFPFDLVGGGACRRLARRESHFPVCARLRDRCSLASAGRCRGVDGAGLRGVGGRGRTGRGLGGGPGRRRPERRGAPRRPPGGPDELPERDRGGVRARLLARARDRARGTHGRSSPELLRSARSSRLRS